MGVKWRVGFTEGGLCTGSKQADERECSKCAEKGKDEPRLQVGLRTATSEIRSHSNAPSMGPVVTGGLLMSFIPVLTKISTL